MANEAVLVFETSKPIPFTCADGATIEKGTFVIIADPFTVSATAADHDAVIGITAEEKIASDGKVKVSVYTSGIFKGVAGTAGVTAGEAINMDSGTSAVNKLADCAVNGENVVGRSLETAAAGETFLFQLNPFTFNAA
jgi:hypothetical protein